MNGVLVIVAIATVLGVLLGSAAVLLRVEKDPLVRKIDALLPQTQCGQCGYAGCSPYAEAIAREEADINQCPPGGATTIAALAELLGREAIPLDVSRGEEKPPMVAVVDETRCIGCTICIQACPVDAIIGTARRMHTVIASECTGCDLCIEPCPVDCIEMVPLDGPGGGRDWIAGDRAA